MTPNIAAVVRQNMEITERVMRNAHGYVVADNALGLTVQSSFDNTTAQSIVKMIPLKLVLVARSAVRDIDPTDDLDFLRIQTRKGEFLVAPETDYTIVVMQ